MNKLLIIFSVTILTYVSGSLSDSLSSTANASTLSTCRVSYSTLEDPTDTIFYYQVEKLDYNTNSYTTIYQNECENASDLNEVVQQNCGYIILEGVYLQNNGSEMKLSTSCG